MGITGLLPFLDKHSKKTNISEFAGKTVAIDTYCWLHKGAFSCADKIIMGQPTDLYVKYCMKFVNMLLSHNIKPILVFDGRHLPAKAETESKRRETRDANRKRAAELIKMGNNAEGKNLLRRSLDVSHKMALEVIKECQTYNVDCIVAPYEADAQLAYLNLSGIADVVITEDSDLTLFGCTKVFFKMDLYGNGVLVEQSQLHLAMGLKLSNFNIDKFRHMCILSGCDYLASLPGIGLGKACKFIVKNTDDNIYNALQRLASSLNMKNLVVTNEYRDNFMRALVTFKHQLVYCPLKRKQVRLNPPTPDVTEEQLVHAGTEVNPKIAWQLALGNCDPFTKERLHDFDPDNVRPKRTNSWSETASAKHPSIWSQNFRIKKVEEKKVSSPRKDKLPAKLASTRGQVATMAVDSLKKELTPRKRTFEEAEMSIQSIVKLYKKPDPKTVVEAPKSTESPGDDEPTSPVFVRRSNPFKKVTETSPSLLHKRTRRLPVKSRLTPTVIDETAVQQSEYFAPKRPPPVVIPETMDVAESMDVNIDEEDYKENVKLCSTPPPSPTPPVRRVIIPETEDFDDEVLAKEDEEKDSGYKGSNDDKDFNRSAMSYEEPVGDKTPLHVVQSYSVRTNGDLVTDFHDRLRVDGIQKLDSPGVEEPMEFSITREVFSEYKSSMFAYESPTPEKRLKRDGYSTPNLRKNSQLSQGSSSRRIPKTTATKKTGTIRGQQSLLNMYGFQKKNSLKH